MVIDGILFRTRTGCPWRDLPGEYGNWKTVYNRHRRWSLDGTGEKILDRLRAGCDEAEGPEWTVSADSTVIRAHQHAAGARHELPAELLRGAPPNDKNLAGRPAREALGRSRGGLSTKIHLAADRRCRPVTWILTPGQHGDCPQFIPLLDQVRIARRGKGRPRTRPGRALADKAYSSAADRAYLRRRGIQAVIPVKEDQKKHRRARPGRRPAARVRPGTIQGAQHRRAVLQQAQAVPRRRDPLRQARLHVPGYRRRRLDPDLAARPGLVIRVGANQAVLRMIRGAG